jgi:LDH2 family malate/lactate/ureidoglycolate dehydrogenase
MSRPPADRVHLPLAEARRIALRALRGIGYDKADATILADHMIDAACCGYEYSGLPKILQIAQNPRSKRPRTPIRPIHETEVSVLLDGGNHSGMIAMHHATTIAIDKAQRHGFALVGVTNSWMSGRSAYYVERIARADLIAIHTVGASSLLAPPGGARPALGTNPIAFGFPTMDEPLVIDVSAAAFPGTELDFHALLGLPLPEGVALDENGVPTTDAEAAKRGALLPFGEHKGFALAVAMQALGVLAGSGLNASKDYGYLIIAMRPDLLVPLDAFKRDLRDTLARIKATPKQPGVDEIRLPSERAFRERALAATHGIVIDRSILQALRYLATQAEIDDGMHDVE